MFKNTGLRISMLNKSNLSPNITMNSIFKDIIVNKDIQNRKVSNDYLIKNSLSVEHWTEPDFSLKKKEWQELLSSSDADPLFMSWNWMFEWWAIRKNDNRRLFIIAIYEEKLLIAIAPLYIEKVKMLKGVISTRRLQFLGTVRAGSAGIRAEYMDFIVRENRQQYAMLSVLQEISNCSLWTELFLSDFNTASQNYPLIKHWLKEQSWHGRVESEGYTFIVDSSLGFDGYLKSLGKNTRLKLFNRRKLLEKSGRVELEFINKDNKDEFYKMLNVWHLKRWDKPVFDCQNKQFFDRVFDFSDDSFSLKYSCILKLDDKPLSVIINADSGNRIYNIQLGFIEDYNNKIALGTLHIGYILEHAFNQPNIKVVDFLEGNGKNSNYKNSLARKDTRLESSRWFRGGLMKFVFKFYDRWLRKDPLDQNQ